MPNILIYGSATHRNLGDLSMMHGLISYLRKTRPDARIVLVTRNPEYSESVFGIPCMASPDQDISFAGKTPPRKWEVVIRGMVFLTRFFLWRHASRRLAELVSPQPTLSFFLALSQANALVIHGSGSFNSLFWYGWLYPKAFSSMVCSALGVPVLATSQSIGPFTSALDRFMAAALLRRAAFFGVRDAEASRRRAVEAGAGEARIFNTGDDSDLLSNPDPETVTAVLRSESIPENATLIGVNFRDGKAYDTSFRDEGYDTLAAALDRLVQSHHAHLVFIPISFDDADDDRKSAERVRALMKTYSNATIIRREHPAPVLRGIVGRMDAAVGVSYHFLLFALGSGVPVVALTRNPYYLHKHSSLLSPYGLQEYRIDLAGTEPKTLADRIGHALSSRSDIGAILAKRRSELEAETSAARKEFARLL